MAKIGKRIFLCLCLAAAVWCGTLLADRQLLNEDLIRFHVVADSDDPEDQQVKLLVRDAVVESLSEDLSRLADVEQAKAYLQENLPKIQQIANQTLAAAGVEEASKEAEESKQGNGGCDGRRGGRRGGKGAGG